MDALAINAIASVASESEIILTQKAASFVKTQTWSHPTVEDESRYVEQQCSSTVDDDVRQDHEAESVSKATTSEEHMLSPAAATSPRVDESVEQTINQFIEEHEDLPGDVSEIQLGSSDEPMDRNSSISSRIHNSKTKLQKKKNVFKKLIKSVSSKMKSKESGHVPTTQKMSVIKEDAVALSIKPSGSITAVENPGLDVARTASTSLMDKDDEDEPVIAAEHFDEEVPVAKLPTELDVDVTKTASSSLMDKDDEDETDAVAEHLDEEVPKAKEERKPLNSLANLLTLGVCSVNPDTSTTEFKIDHVESDGYDAGSAKTNEDEPAPKGLFSCGAAAPTSPRKGIFDGLTTAQSDAAVGVTTDIDDEEVKALTSQANLLSIGEKNTTEVQANGSEESLSQQQSVSSIPSVSEGSETNAPVTEMKEGEEEEAQKSNSEEEVEAKEIKLTKTSSTQNKSIQRVQPSESKEIKLTKTSSTQNKSIQRVQPSESKEIKLTKTSSTQNKSIQRVQPSESKEIKLTKTNSTQNKSIQRVQPSESKEIKLTKTSSTQNKSIQRVQPSESKEIKLTKSSSTQNKSIQRVQPSESKEIKLTKTNSTQNKSIQRVQSSESKEIKLTKTNSTQNKSIQRVQSSKSKEIKLTKTNSTQNKSIQRVQPTESKEIKLTKTNSTQNKSIQRVQPSESKEIKLTKTNSTQNKSIQRVQPSESKEIKLTKSNSTQNKSTQRVQPSESKEIKLTKTSSTQNKSIQRVQSSESKEIKLTKTSSTEGKSLQRVSFESKEEIKLTKTNSTQDKSLQRVEPSESKEIKLTKTSSTQNKSLFSFQKTKNAFLSSLRAPRISKRMRSLPHELDDPMKMETESLSKPDQQAALMPQESSEKSLGNPPETIELENILDKTKTDSTDLLEDILDKTKTNSTDLLAAPPFCFSDADFDHYKEKSYGLMEKFGQHVKDLKKKRAEVLAKELETKETKEAMQRTDTLKAMKRMKRELARLEKELEKLRKEEEVAKVPVDRLHEFLNAELDSKIDNIIDSKINGNGGSEKEKKSLGKLFNKSLQNVNVACCMCGEFNNDEEDFETVLTGSGSGDNGGNAQVNDSDGIAKAKEEEEEDDHEDDHIDFDQLKFPTELVPPQISSAVSHAISQLSKTSA